MRAKHIVMLAMVSALGLNGYGAWAAGTGTAQTNAATPAQPGGDDGRAVPALPGNPIAQERVEANRPDLDRAGRPERVDSDRPERAELHRADVERPEVQRPEVERPEVQRPEVERPEVQRPEVERPEVQRPERPEVERPDNGER